MKLDPSAFIAEPELIEALETKSTCISYEEDSVLFREGDPPAGLYILSKGEVTLLMTSPVGKEVVSIQAATGSLLGLPGLIGNQPYTLTAIARKNARLCFITRDAFTGLMRSEPLLSLKVLQVLAAEVRSARQAIREL